MTTNVKPAEALLGMHLVNDWVVVDSVTRPDDATGGHFSMAYLVTKTSGGAAHSAFLKALDFTVIETLDLPIVDSLNHVTDAYIFERDIVLACAGRRMSNVVRAIDAGEVVVDSALFDPRYAIVSKVPYIIFEVADGDVRSIRALQDTTNLDVAWALRVLHGVANGLRQLHQAGITHQDVKPSNVMAFPDTAKLGDLGRASTSDGGLFDDATIPGDRTYAPPELLYDELHADQRVRRRASDMYHLASMAVFLFAGVGLTPLIESELDSSFHWRTWPGDYRNVLPYVRVAFDNGLVRLAEGLEERSWAEELLQVIRQLGDPDPLVRGNPSLGSGPRRYSMERYVSIFDRLARTAEAQVRCTLV